jgi:beta-lactamase superfamily II metal-dependent hydrolase
MFRIEMLPAACGDCLWIEYGTTPATHIVIIDGGVRATAKTLRNRIAMARRERNAKTLEVELLVVTHIDNDHIQGVIELLQGRDPHLHIKDIWFNGRSQLNALPALPAGFDPKHRARKSPSSTSSDFLGGTKKTTERSSLRSGLPVASADFLGVQQGDQLSKLLEQLDLPWNRRTPCGNGAIVAPDHGVLQTIALDGGLNLTLLGPSLPRLHDLRTMWNRAVDGDEDARILGLKDDFLARTDTWPPVWKAAEQHDLSVTNGSSIMLLAEFDGTSVLLTGDAHAIDIAEGVERLRQARDHSAALPIAAFKLAHHGSDKNVTRELLEKIDCRRYLVSTDGSTHRHPDNQALLRILRFATRPVQILFNYASETTRRWGESKVDVLRGGFPDYEPRFPEQPERGMILELDKAP